MLVLFWASWSPVSVSQLETVARLPASQAPGEQWERVGIVLDVSGGEQAREIVEEIRPGFLQVSATRATIQAWGNLPVLPVLCEIGADGRIRRWHEGYLPASEVLAWRREAPP